MELIITTSVSGEEIETARMEVSEDQMLTLDWLLGEGTPDTLPHPVVGFLKDLAAGLHRAHFADENGLVALIERDD